MPKKLKTWVHVPRLEAETKLKEELIQFIFVAMVRSPAEVRLYQKSPPRPFPAGM